MGVNIQPAYADEEPSLGFARWGESTVEWMIDEHNKLIIRPLGNVDEGTMPHVDNFYARTAPWKGKEASITSVEFQKVVHSKGSLIGLFAYMNNVSSISFGDFDTSQATSMNWLFYECSSLESIDLSHLDTSNVKFIGFMFRGCSSLTSLDLSHFDTSKVMTMQEMFRGCSSLTSLDLSTFVTTQTTGTLDMFANCSSLRTIYVGDGWVVSERSRMFQGCNALIGGNNTHFDPAHINGDYARIDAVGAPGYLTRGTSIEGSAPSVIGTLTYGDSVADHLSLSTQEGSMYVVGKGVVSGTWALDATDKPNAGSTKVAAIFTPTDQSIKPIRQYLDLSEPVKQRRLKVTVNPNQEVLYGMSTAKFTYAIENVLEKDRSVAESTLQGSLGGYSASLEPGSSYAITAGDLKFFVNSMEKQQFATNYTFDPTTDFTPATFSVKLIDRIIEPENTTLIYNGSEQSILSLESGNDISEAFEVSDVNTIKAMTPSSYSATLTPKPGYVWGSTGLDRSQKTFNWKIDKRPLTVVADTHSVAYGAADEELSYKVTGLDPLYAQGDSEQSVFNGKPLVRAQGSEPSEYSITQGEFDLLEDQKANYDLTFVEAQYTIKPKGKIEIPYAEVGLIYNGKSQTGVKSDSSEVVLTGNSAIQAKNTYTATASLADGYVWLNGNGAYDRSQKTISWSIAEKDLIVNAQNKSSEVGAPLKPLTYEVVGLVAGDSKEDVFSGDIERDGASTNPGTYQIVQGSLALGGTKGANYNLKTFNAASYTITEQGKVALPTPNKLIYSGEPQNPFEGVENIIFRDNIQTEVDASYTAYAKPNEGFTWSDGGTEERPITWSIDPLSIKVKAQDARSVYGEDLVDLKVGITSEYPQTDALSDIFKGELASSVTPTSDPGVYRIEKGSLALNSEGKGKNYSFDPEADFTQATYTLSAKGALEIPFESIRVIYRGQAQSPQADNIDFGGSYLNETEVGSYSATATPQAGYVWAQGDGLYDRSAKDITWYITQREITVTPKAKEIYVGQELPTFDFVTDPAGLEAEISGSFTLDRAFDNSRVDTYNIISNDIALKDTHNNTLVVHEATLSVVAKPITPSNPGGGFIPGASFPGSSTQQPGWVSNDGYWYLFDDKGNTLTGWQVVDNMWYYLNEQGEMQTGWTYTNGTWYYLNTSGAMQTGWFSDTYNWYYLDNSGAMQTGWIYTNNTWYLTDTSGAMKTGWEYVGGAWYHLDTTGAMTTGWYSDGYNWYYLNTTGEMATGTQSIDGVTYTFDSNGAWIV